MLSEAEVLDKRASDVGVALSKIDWEIHELFNDINFGPDLSDETERAFRTLQHVRDLVNVAIHLYPYDYEEPNVE